MGARAGFLIGPRGDGFDVAAAALAAHPDVHLARDAHVLTAFARLGYYDKVYRAAYDHVLAAEAQRLFVERLPRGEADYLDACRAFCDALYARALEASGKRLIIDATPEYAEILPFLRRVLPEAPCAVVTRHPFALLADPEATPAAVRQFVQAVAALRRRAAPRTAFIRAEDLAREPEAALGAVADAFGVGFLPAMAAAAAATRLSPAEEWAPRALERLSEARRLVRSLQRGDLEAYGYSLDELWRPLDAANGRAVPRTAPTRPRPLLVRGQALTRRSKRLSGALRRIRLAADVLLRPGS